MLKKSDNRGFTFIELIVYIAILSIFMVAVMTLIGSTVTSNKKANSRKKLMNQATETYDTIADMLMGASDVRIHGDAYIGVTTAGVLNYVKKSDSAFVIPGTDLTKDIKDGDGKLIKAGGAERSQRIAGNTVNSGKKCYDIADIKPFLDATDPSSDTETFIDVKSLFIRYSSGIDATTKEDIITCCTITYDKDGKTLYVHRISSNDGAYLSAYPGYYESTMIAKTNNPGNIICKNVENFQLQVNADTGTFALILEYKDSKTGATYSTNGVVSLRNSFVLKSHEWN